MRRMNNVYHDIELSALRQVNKDIAVEHTPAISQAALGLALLGTNQPHIGARSQNAR